MGVPFDAATTLRFQNNAEDEFAYQANCIIDRIPLPITAGTAIYNLPSYCTNVKRVTYRGWKVFPLPHRDLRQAFQSGIQQSRPYWYIFNNIGQNQIRLFPVPSEDVYSTYYLETLSDNPNIYYRVDETFGSLVNDYSPNSLGGIYNGGPLFSQPGGIVGDSDTAVSFNGTTDFITVADNTLLDPGDIFTLELIISPHSQSGQPGIFDKGNTGGAGYIVTIVGGLIVFGSTVDGTICTSTSPITFDTFQHLAITKAGSNVHIYINGVDVSGVVTNHTITNTSNVLTIGKNVGTGKCLQAIVDEIAIYPTALSAARIARKAAIRLSATANDSQFWGSAIQNKCIVEFFRLPNQGAFIIPAFLRLRLLNYYANKRNFAMEGRTQDIKASKYWNDKFETFKEIYTELLEDLQNKPRKLLANTKTQRPYGYIPPPPILPIDRFGYTVDDYNG